MKYKAGDKVKIKTWEEMAKEFGISGGGIYCDGCSFMAYMEYDLNKLNCNRILTIKNLNQSVGSEYEMEEISCRWIDNMIECSANDYVEEVFAPILNRYEILDLRGYL